MDKHHMGDKDFGVHVNHEFKFSDLRQKAHDEYRARGKRRKKDKKEIVPKHKPDDIVVITSAYSGSIYDLVEIVDFCVNSSYVEYFGILLKTTDKKSLDRIGRLVHIGGFWRSGLISNIPPDSIKWLEEKDNVQGDSKKATK